MVDGGSVSAVARYFYVTRITVYATMDRERTTGSQKDHKRIDPVDLGEEKLLQERIFLYSFRIYGIVSKRQDKPEMI